jgi:predicted metal-binding protein
VGLRGNRHRSALAEIRAETGGLTWPAETPPLSRDGLEYVWMDEPTVTIFVCVSCRRSLGEAGESFDQPGRDLVAALQSRLQDGRRTGVAVTPVDCLAVCKRPCTVALAGADKWTYLIGDLDPDSHAEEIVAAALSFAASENGIIPWRERPASFRKGVIARVPPIATGGTAGVPVPETIQS